MATEGMTTLPSRASMPLDWALEFNYPRTQDGAAKRNIGIRRANPLRYGTKFAPIQRNTIPPGIEPGTS